MEEAEDNFNNEDVTHHKEEPENQQEQPDFLSPHNENNDAGPPFDYLSYSMERSNFATVNSIDSSKMKEFIQEGPHSGNILERPVEVEKHSENEAFLIGPKLDREAIMADVTSYLTGLFESINEKVSAKMGKKEAQLPKDSCEKVIREEEEKDSFENAEEGDLKAQKNELRADNGISNNKRVHFRSTETEIGLSSSANIKEECEIQQEGKFDKVKLLPDFLWKSPGKIKETANTSLNSLMSKTKEKMAAIQPPVEPQLENGIDESSLTATAHLYLSTLYKACLLQTNLLESQASLQKTSEIQAEPPREKTPQAKQALPKKSIRSSPPPVSKARNLSAKPSPNDKPLVKRANPVKELATIKTKKDEIHEKLKEIEVKLVSIPSVLDPLKTPSKRTPKGAQTLSNNRTVQTEDFLKKFQEKKVDIELKKAQKLEEKESILKADIEKLNSEKQKILEVFKLEKEKLFWRKMHELEERKADRIQKEMEYKSMVKGMIKNNQFPIKTPELERKKQEVVEKKKLLSEYSRKVRVEHLEKLEKTPPIPKILEKPKKNIRSITPNQRPNYLLEIKQKNKELQEKAGVRLKKDYENWEKYLKDEKLNKNEKFTSVLNRAQIMENQAKMKEKVVAFTGNGIDIEMENEINELYVDSIKAKIALLEKLKD